MNPLDEKDIDPIYEMSRLAEKYLNLDRWNFRQSFHSPISGDLIYDSEYCRLNLVWGGWDYTGGNSISIYYGRLHAQNSKATMMWKGEECHCWHRIEHALHFLDGRTVADAASFNYSHPLIEPFYKEEIRQKFQQRQPEWLVTIHATVWQHYDTRFFELFDLRNPELWEQYRQYLKEFYDIKGRSLAINPPLDKVC